MKILIDTNIVLDLLLERSPFVEDAIVLFEMVEMRQIQGYIAATTVTNVFYIVRKVQGRDIALLSISRMLAGLEQCSC